MKTVKGTTALERVKWLQDHKHLLWNGLPLKRENYDIPHDRLLKKIFNMMKAEGLYGPCMHVTTADLHSVITLTRKLNAVVHKDMEVNMRHYNAQSTTND